MKQLRSLIPLLCGMFLLNACGGAGGTQALPTLPTLPPIPPTAPPSITVAFAGFAPAVHALDMGQSEGLTAIVTHDPTNSGVTWGVACPTGVLACGAMASAASASGAPDQFNAPANISAAITLTITAASKKDPTKSVSVQLTVNPAPTIAGRSALPDGFVAQRYGPMSGPWNCSPYCTQGVAFGVSGGIPPYAWNWIGAPKSSLPPGLIFTGSTHTQVLPQAERIICPSTGICGTPTVAGTYNVIITVTDSASPTDQASENYTIIIH
jgi:hypothetical protein